MTEPQQNDTMAGGPAAAEPDHQLAPESGGRAGGSAVPQDSPGGAQGHAAGGSSQSAAAVRGSQEGDVVVEMVSGNESAKAKRDAECIVRILKSMGVNQFDTRVLHQLRELLYWYSMDVLQEALYVSQIFVSGREELGWCAPESHEHTVPPKKEVDIEDVRLAIKIKVTHNGEFSNRPDQELLEQWAKDKNSRKLPAYPSRGGILLPPEVFQLTSTNYNLMPPRALPPNGDAPRADAAPAKRRRFGVKPCAPANLLVVTLDPR